VKGTRCRNNTGLWLLLSHRTNSKCGHRQQPLAPSSLFHLSPSFFSPPLFLCRLSFSPCCVFDRSVLCGVLCGSKSRICLSLCLLCQPSRVIDRSESQQPQQFTARNRRQVLQRIRFPASQLLSFQSLLQPYLLSL
jgi:hypothetical protein